MRQIREILRQKWLLGRSHRQVAQSLDVGLGTVSSVVQRARGVGLDWPQVEALAEEGQEARLYGARARPVPEFAWLHAERRRPPVTLEILHLEYLQQHPTGYRYTRFCDLYRGWLAWRGLPMRQEHRAGEKVFVDCAGQKPSLVDPATAGPSPSWAACPQPWCAISSRAAWSCRAATSRSCSGPTRSWANTTAP